VRDGGVGQAVAARHQAGFLRIETDRGDRFYIALLSAAVILAGWIAVTDLSMWLALACALLVAAVIGRWG